MDWMHNNILRIAEVLEVHPESNSISVRFVDDGSRIPDIPVMSSSGSSRTGTVDLPAPEVPEDETHDPTETERIYSLAVIAMTSTLPVCIGFVQPAVNELAFKDIPNLRVWRHASDVYSVVQDNADMEIHHPGGAMIKIGDPEPFDLEGKDYDEKWQIRRNPTPKTLRIANGMKKSGGGNGNVSRQSAQSAQDAGSEILMNANANMDLKSQGWLISSGQELNRVESANVVHIRAGVEIVLEAPMIRINGAIALGPPGKLKVRIPDDPACLPKEDPSPEDLYPPECMRGDPASRPDYCPADSLNIINGS